MMAPRMYLYGESMTPTSLAPSGRQCPECGSKMNEVERCVENCVLFVWYECSRDDCDGQWLQKGAALPDHTI